MKPQWQQQQQQMRQQQEQMRQRQMAAAWMEQQKAKQQQAEAMTPVSDRFAMVEQAAMKLRQQIATGKLTQEQAQAQMKEMMVQDDDGTWWTVGFETGGWYYYSGESWVAGSPRRNVIPSFKPPVPAAAKPRRFQALVTLIIGLAITGGVGIGVGNIAYEQFSLGDTGAWIIVIALWLTGLWITIKRMRKLWRG